MKESEKSVASERKREGKRGDAARGGTEVQRWRWWEGGKHTERRKEKEKAIGGKRRGGIEIVKVKRKGERDRERETDKERE